ncbi:MAG: hypothetical protein FJZ07_00875 [Candidatus Nealsonbacteria bacterium]|nr:hypothetical protein [Candidatus Nealsonbacteria bacterium]
MRGIRIAALYGFYPHRLGFCGLQQNSAKKTLLNYLSGEKISEQKIRKILETFKGSFSYYKLIAKSNGIEDPFEKKVVKAYWIGNQLLEKVSINSLKRMIIKEFAGPGLFPREITEKKASEIPLTSKPHHSFHVLVIGSVSGRIVLEDKLLDICRIGWGKVIKKSKTKILIKYQPLVKKSNKFRLGKSIHKVVFWDKKFIPEVKIGDKIATHWNYIVQVLSTKDLVNLKKYTQITIDSLGS